jgi:hypothetical protein
MQQRTLCPFPFGPPAVYFRYVFLFWMVFPLWPGHPNALNQALR